MMIGAGPLCLLFCLSCQSNSPAARIQFPRLQLPRHPRVGPIGSARSHESSAEIGHDDDGDGRRPFATVSRAFRSESMPNGGPARSLITRSRASVIHTGRLRVQTSRVFFSADASALLQATIACGPDHEGPSRIPRRVTHTQLAAHNQMLVGRDQIMRCPRASIRKSSAGCRVQLADGQKPRQMAARSSGAIELVVAPLLWRIETQKCLAADLQCSVALRCSRTHRAARVCILSGGKWFRSFSRANNHRARK